MPMKTIPATLIREHKRKDYDVHLVIIQMLHPDLFCLMFTERTAGVLILYAHTCVQAVSRKT